ncbi:MAG TPA: hypothetical protein VL285_05760 [Bryobacteraceae bacterium]|nr:hypothetical protein [Bryobacteraceae bacterium]
MHSSYDNTLDRRQWLALGFPFFFWRKRGIRLEGARFEILRHGAARRVFLHIHGNEETARGVLRAHLKTHTGTAYLIRGDKRNVPADSGQLDPNRMFSRDGAQKNLRALNKTWSEEQIRSVLDKLDRGRERLVRALLPANGRLLMAVHNNSEGYSVRDEVPISDRVWLPEPDHPHEFFLCTQTEDFETLSKSPYNAALQNTAPPDDDGSLSRLAAKRGARYLNLECALGNAARQREMLEWADSHLR